MTCRWLGRAGKRPGRWHQLWCADCQAAQETDAILERGVAQLRSEAALPTGLTRTLAALGLPDHPQSVPEAPIRRKRGSVVRRRMAIGVAAAVAGVYLAMAFVGRSEMAALAGTMAALGRVTSYHLRGVEISNGQPLRWEIWHSAGRHREDREEKITVDDGRHRRSYRAGSRVVFVDRSWLARRGARADIFEPGGFLKRIEEMSREPGWIVRVEKPARVAHQGRALESYEIRVDMDQRVHPSHNQKGRLTLLIDPVTKLPVRWTSYEWQEGRWQLRQRIDQLDYDIAIPERVFRLELPPGTRTVDVDWSHRAQARLAARPAADGREIVLRAIDMTRDRDLMVSVAHEKEGRGMEVPTAATVQMRATDERGRAYVDADSGFVAPTFEMRWLVPLTPGRADEPWPKRLTITMELPNTEKVIFRDIPAPPPAYESVRELPPYHDTKLTDQDVENTRARARARAR